jgi:hypothetical protein
VRGSGQEAVVLYQLYYEQSRETSSLESRGLILSLPLPSCSLAFDDSTLEPIKAAWKWVMRTDEGADGEAEYMVFSDREGAADDGVYD